MDTMPFGHGMAAGAEAAVDTRDREHDPQRGCQDR